MKFFGDSFNVACSEIMKDWVLVNFKGLIFVNSLGISYAVFWLDSSPPHLSCIHFLHFIPSQLSLFVYYLKSHQILLMLPRLFGVWPSPEVVRPACSHPFKESWLSLTWKPSATNSFSGLGGNLCSTSLSTLEFHLASARLGPASPRHPKLSKSICASASLCVENSNDHTIQCLWLSPPVSLLFQEGAHFKKFVIFTTSLFHLKKCLPLKWII